MGRVQVLAMDILRRNKSLFSNDFEKNKEVLSQIAIIRSKQLRNELAGYIASYLKKNEENNIQKSDKSLSN